jgi:hypothetical protein
MFHLIQPHEAFNTPSLNVSSVCPYNIVMSVNVSFQALTAVVDQLVASLGFLREVVDEFDVSK